MGKKYRAHSCLLQSKILLPNHSVVCDHSATAELRNPVPFCKIGGLLMFLQHATKSSLTEHALSAHQISKRQEITQKELCLFLFAFHPSLNNCFLSHTFIASYKTYFLPAFLILQVQNQALLLQPVSSKHCHLSAQISPALPSWQVLGHTLFFQGLLSDAWVLLAKFALPNWLCS